jgi:hypothetical protein
MYMYVDNASNGAVPDTQYRDGSFNAYIANNIVLRYITTHIHFL